MTGAVKMFKLDFLSMKVYFRSYLIFLAYPILFAWWGPTGMAIMGGLMLAMLGSSIFSVQEKNKMERLYGVLAITESSLVAGRYLFLLANCLLVQVVMLPIHNLAGRFSGQTWEQDEFLFAIGLSYLLFWLLASFQVPLYFKFGYTKMRMWVSVPFIIIALVPTLFATLLKENLQPLLPLIEAFFENLLRNSFSFMVFCLVAGTLLGLISYLASTRIYRSTKR